MGSLTFFGTELLVEDVSTIELQMTSSLNFSLVKHDL